MTEPTTDRQRLAYMASRFDAFRLSDVRDTQARAAEREARLIAFDSDDRAPGYEMVSAPGCHGEPQPPTVGYVWTREAAEDLASRLTHMPGGSCHHELVIA